MANISLQIIKENAKNCLLELPTSYGKTRIALELMKKKNPNKILIVIPRLVLVNNWKEEIKKWGCTQYTSKISFSTYVSFPKHAGEWDLVIFDECHHLSERCRECLKYFTINSTILLSATVKRELRQEFTYLFKPLQIYRITTKKAIEEGKLPEPTVYLIPLQLDRTTEDCVIVKNKNKGNPITIRFNERWNYKGVKNRTIYIKCTQQQYYSDISSLIEWYRPKIYSELYKNLFLRTSGDRLKWLSDQKTTFIYNLLRFLSKERTLTFCNSILQTEILGKYCINSKNGVASRAFLSAFNEGKISHITACNMLDEGMNLVNCRVGVYASLNSSERMIKQKLGRLLRHPNPIIIIPYFVGTRDEEIVKTMCEDYNPELIKVVNNYTEIQL